jgi:predicted MFS family arabinose efflux permease
MNQRTYSRDIVLILAASFFYLSSPMLVTPLITGFSASVGASAGLMGIIGGLMNLCALFCRPLVGNLADWVSKYRLSFVGAGLMALSCLGYVLAPNAVVIVLARIVNGVGYACCSVCMSTWMSNLLPKDKIGSGMGIYGMMNALGMAVAPAIGVNLYQALGYRVAFVLALAFSLATILIIQFVSDRGEPQIKPESGSHAGHRERLQIVDKKVLPIALLVMLFAIPYCATQSFLVNYVESRGLAVSVSLFFPLYAAVLLVLRFSLKGLFDRLPFRFFLFGSCLSALLGISCLAWMNSNLMMFLAAVFMAGGYGIMCSVCQSTAILLAGEGRRGLANSTYYVGLDLGMTLGPIFGGFLFGNIDLKFFYPVLLITVPLELVVYLAAKRQLSGKTV